METNRSQTNVDSDPRSIPSQPSHHHIFLLSHGNIIAGHEKGKWKMEIEIEIEMADANCNWNGNQDTEKEEEKGMIAFQSSHLMLVGCIFCMYNRCGVFPLQHVGCQLRIGTKWRWN